MTNNDFVEKLINISNMKTYYIKGGFGLVLNDKGKQRAIKSYKWNADRADKINSQDPDTFGFDCCGLIKGCIWGFEGDNNKVYGGAAYKSKGLDDLNEKGLLGVCHNISDNFTNIKKGEFLYMPGHCGIYIGNNKVVESTPAFNNGVQITDINARKWKVHGTLDFINYQAENTNNSIPVIPVYYLKMGSRGMNVYNLQKCLNFLGADLDLDGCFGILTKTALKDFQKKYNLIIDGVYGPQCQRKLKEVIG